MPIKDPSIYPKNWKEIRGEILARARDVCECIGLCGIGHQCPERNGEKAINFNGVVVLTIAHLCFDPPCDDRRHLRAMCQRCHNRYDNSHRVRNAASTRRIKKMEVL